MSLRTEAYSSRRDTVAFLVCLLLAIMARAAPPTVSAGIASVLRETVLRPFLTIQHQTELIRFQRREFATLVAQRDSAVRAANEIILIQAENFRLRTLLRLSQRLVTPHVAGEVLHQIRRNDGTQLIVTAGANDGVEPWAPVISAEGLIGHVEVVDESTSQVLAWTHRDFRASATSLDGSVVGILASRVADGPATQLELREVAAGTEVEPGTLVVTSGLGGVYPQGIPVGTVGELIEEQVGWSRTYLVRPAVHPASVSHVIILLTSQSMTGIFPVPNQ